MDQVRTREPASRRATLRVAVSAMVVLALLAPMALDRDSFPLSTYPMYAHNRGQVVTIVTVVGVEPDGSVRRLGLPTIADSDDPLETAAFVRSEVRDGRAAELCRAVAGRLDDPSVRLEVVSETHNAVDYTRGDESLLGREVHASCAGSP